MKSASFVGMNKYEIAQYNAARSNKNDKITAGSILRNSQSSRKAPYVPNQNLNNHGVSRFSPYGEDQQYPSGSEQNQE